jgi:hypothetical protein
MKVIKASKFVVTLWLFCLLFHYQVAVSEQQHTALIIKRKDPPGHAKKINGNKVPNIMHQGNKDKDQFRI